MREVCWVSHVGQSMPNIHHYGYCLSLSVITAQTGRQCCSTLFALTASCHLQTSVAAGYEIDVKMWLGLSYKQDHEYKCLWLAVALLLIKVHALQPKAIQCSVPIPKLVFHGLAFEPKLHSCAKGATMLTLVAATLCSHTLVPSPVPLCFAIHSGHC